MKKGLSVEQIREVELELTGTCNLDCPLCIRSYENGKHLVVKNIRPLQEWIDQLETFPNLQYACISGSVSEPTLYEEFLPLMRYLVSRNCEIEIYTNANTHDELWWTELGTILKPTVSSPYQERFNIIKNTTDIKMPKIIGKKYNIIKNASLKRYDDGVKCEMKCKSFELRFLNIDNFGNIHPCFLYRIYKGTPFDHNDYSEIHEFKNKFCYECESLTKSMLERNGMERMG